MLLLLIILFYALLVLCFPLLLSCLVSAAQSSNISVSECSARNCGNLTDVGYPFGWEGSHCGASPYFLLSNCNGKATPLWPGLNATYIDSPQTPAPAVIGINVTPDGRYNHVNLSWAQSINAYTSNSENPKCEPLPLNSSISYGFPSSIKFLYATASADFFHDFQFSANNIVLLFNCSNTTAINASNVLVNDTDYCQKYNNFCDNTINYSYTNSCHAYNGHRELDLDNFIANYSCTHFQFFTVERQFLDVQDWNQYALQLTWSYNDFPSSDSCQQCQNHSGSCGFSGNSNVTDFKCFCSAKSGDYCRNDQRYKIILGVTISSSIAISIILIVSTVLWLKRRRKTKIYSGASGASSSSTSDKTINAKLQMKRALSLSSKFGPFNAEEFSYDEILAATDSLADDKIIGDGGFGAVYVGVLKDGREVAVKRLYHESFRRMNHFYNEMKILSRLNHPNLVKLYGFCSENDKDLLLVFEYASKGTVFDQLHNENSRTGEMPAMVMKQWKLRLRIAWETSQALSYLHNFVSPPIFHRDVKTTNILLDECFHAKLADFGLSRLVPDQVTHVSTAPQGTPGYVDPDYQHCYQLTDKSDVYSFGVVLMELVSGKLPVDLTRQKKEINLSGLTVAKVKEGCWEELVDPCLGMDKDPSMVTCIHRVVELAFECLQPEKDDRPDMKQVTIALSDLYKGFGDGELDDGALQTQTSESFLAGQGRDSSTSVCSSSSNYFTCSV